MKTYSNLMFDLGGVIMDIRRENAVAALEAIGVADADTLLGEYTQKGIFLQLEKGLISADEFRRGIRKSIAHQVSDREIDDAFGRFLLGIPVHRLRQLEQLHRTHRIYLLSNTNPILWDNIILDEFRKDGHDINYYFDGIVASFMVKAYKPDAEIFEIACRQFGIEAADTVFYDDSAANVEAARALGFGGIHVKGDRPFADYLTD